MPGEWQPFFQNTASGQASREKLGKRRALDEDLKMEQEREVSPKRYRPARNVSTPHSANFDSAIFPDGFFRVPFFVQDQPSIAFDGGNKKDASPSLVTAMETDDKATEQSSMSTTLSIRKSLSLESNRPGIGNHFVSGVESSRNTEQESNTTSKNVVGDSVSPNRTLETGAKRENVSAFGCRVFSYHNDF